MKKRITFLLSFSLLFIATARSGSISGKLIDSGTKAAIEFAKISVINSTENKMVKGAVTNATGEFNLKELPDGKYLLKASYVGYSPIELPLVIDAKHINVNLGQIALSSTAQNLKQVEVKGMKSQVRFEIDRKVFNVDQNLASAGASATEILRNIPSVEVAADGNVLLRNNKNVTIWINGRPSGLNEDNRTQILEQIPAESIERVEVITNPSSKYSPEGTAGIINIVLKKVRKGGWSGGLSLGGDTNWGYNATTNFYYSSPKWEINANVGYRDDVRNMIFNSDRWSWDPIKGDTVVRYSRDKVKIDGGGLFARTSTTYHLTSKDHITVNALATLAHREVSEKIGNQRIKNLQETVDQRNSLSAVDRNMYNYSLDYTHEFSEKGHEIRVFIEQNRAIADANSEIIQMDSLFRTRYFQWGNSDVKNTETNFQVDYTYPINKESKLEMGYKGEFLTRNTVVVSEYGLTANVRRPQYELNNNFDGSDKRNSVYVNYAGKHKKLTYQLGLRGEYNVLKNAATMYDKANRDSLTTFDNKYPGLYPTLFLDYELPNNNKLQFNYTRRINRPKGRMTNPFRNVADSSNIEYGNPNLKPEYSNAFELSHIKTWDDHMLSSVVYFRTTNNVIQTVNFVRNEGRYDIKYITSQNATNSQAAGFEFMLKNRLFKILDLTSTLNLYYSHLDGFEYESTHYDKEENFGWSGRVNAAVTLPAGITAQISGSYQSRRDIPQGYTQPSWGVDAGLRKAFLNRKLQVNLSARDIFNSRMGKDITTGVNFYDYSEYRLNARSLAIIATYNFGNQKKKPTKGKETEGNPLNGDF